jgi:hypothetical protein
VAGKSNQGAFINGTFYNWARTEWTLGGTKLVAIKSMDWDDELERENVHGAGSAPLGTGEGNYKASWKASVLLEDFEDVIAPQLGNVVYEHEPFDITVMYSKKSGKVVRRDIKGVRLTKISEKGAQGDKETVVELEGMPSAIWRDGKKPVSVGNG